MNPAAILGSLGGVQKLANTLIKVILIAVIAYACYKLYIKWKRRDVGKAWVDPSLLDPNKNYDNIAKECHDVFDGWWTGSEEAENLSKQILALDNNEIKQVNNRYVTLYGNGTRTLQDAIKDMVLCISCDSRNALLEKLQTLGLN